jgi:hypothetical protein
MLRLLFRVFLLIYLVMPIVAGFLVVRTVTQIRDDVAPIYETANTVISRASTAVDRELRNLGNNFAPLVNAVNSIRNAVQSVATFIQNTVYTIIDVLNANPACKITNIGCIPKSFSISLPNLIDLSFLNTISVNLTDITTQVNRVVSTTTTSINSYVTMLTLAVVLLVAWIILSHLLIVRLLFVGLWSQT